MGINMRITPVSFSSKTQKVNSMQDFETLRDQALDRQLKEMLPMFMNGETDIVFISTTVNPDREIQMDVKARKIEVIRPESKEEKTKETFWVKLKKLFDK